MESIKKRKCAQDVRVTQVHHLSLVLSVGMDVQINLFDGSIAYARIEEFDCSLSAATVCWYYTNNGEIPNSVLRGREWGSKELIAGTLQDTIPLGAIEKEITIIPSQLRALYEWAFEACNYVFWVKMRYDYEVGKNRRADLEIPTTLDGKILKIWFARTLRARMHGTLRTKGSGTPKLKYSMPRKMFDVLSMGCRRKREPKRIVISLDLKEFEESLGYRSREKTELSPGTTGVLRKEGAIP